MKISVLLAGISVCAALVSVRADDNSSQAAARAALAQMQFQLEHPQWQLPTNQPAIWSFAAAEINRTSPVQPNARWDSESAMAMPAHLRNFPVAPAATNAVRQPNDISATPTKRAPKTMASVAAPAPKAKAPAALTQRPATRPAPVEAKPSKVALPPPANELITVSGAIYRNVQVERVETNAIVISYSPTGGGLVMTRIFLDELSAESQQQFGKE